MCEKGDAVVMVLPRHPLSDPFGKHLNFAIDRCIAPLVAALNRAGIPTVSCCCGHGVELGWVALGDGHYLVLAENRSQFEHLTSSDAGAHDATNGEAGQE